MIVISFIAQQWQCVLLPENILFARASFSRREQFRKDTKMLSIEPVRIQQQENQILDATPKKNKLVT